MANVFPDESITSMESKEEYLNWHMYFDRYSISMAKELVQF